jgi:hypothetical protein
MKQSHLLIHVLFIAKHWKKVVSKWRNSMLRFHGWSTWSREKLLESAGVPESGVRSPESPFWGTPESGGRSPSKFEGLHIPDIYIYIYIFIYFILQSEAGVCETKRRKNSNGQINSAAGIALHGETLAPCPGGSVYSSGSVPSLHKVINIFFEFDFRITENTNLEL